MSAITFDTLAYAKKLQQVGFTQQQAEAQAEALKEVMDENWATKQDISGVKQDISNVKLDINGLKEDIKQVRLDMHLLEERLTYKLTIRLGLMLVAAITIVTTLIKI